MTLTDNSTHITVEVKDKTVIRAHNFKIKAHGTSGYNFFSGTKTIDYSCIPTDVGIKMDPKFSKLQNTTFLLNVNDSVSPFYEWKETDFETLIPGCPITNYEVLPIDANDTKSIDTIIVTDVTAATRRVHLFDSVSNGSYHFKLRISVKGG